MRTTLFVTRRPGGKIDYTAVRWDDTQKAKAKQKPDQLQWHKGRPPHVGWFCTMTTAGMGIPCWRWFNGHWWSVAVLPQHGEHIAAKMAMLPSAFGNNCILWRHYWPAGARVARVNPDTGVVTGEGPSHQTKALAEAKQKPDPLEWHSGPPPFVGWWSASRARNTGAWRWWDGNNWSTWANDYFSKRKVGIAAATKSYETTDCIEWRWYYPPNARVPRIDPRKQDRPVRADARMCKKCGGHMNPGKALINLASGEPDFPGGEVATMSPDPRKPKLVDCIKCADCGHSISAGAAS